MRVAIALRYGTPPARHGREPPAASSARSIAGTRRRQREEPVSAFDRSWIAQRSGAGRRA
jgi:hypothetical protein